MITWEDIRGLSPVHVQALPDPASIRGVAIDSRKVAADMLFIARRGAAADGHHFIGEALRNGAVAAVVEEEWFTMASPAADWPLVVVRDADQALRDLARLQREKMSDPVLGITGSNGKTTTKEMIARILETRYHPLSTPGNYNNLWGLPLTILQVAPEHDFWILEHGMNRPGEIAELCRISQPTAGLVTTIAEVHSRNFHSVQEIADTKFALYDALPEDGITFQNLNDAFIRDYTPTTRRTVTYGLKSDAGLSGRIDSKNDQGCVRVTIDGIGPVQLQVPGAFQATNALAAAAVGLTFGVPAADIRERLESFQAVPGRGRILTRDGLTIIDDAYNANPTSMKAALDILASFPAERRKVAILGDMLELNSQRDQRHRQIGEYAVSCGIDVVIGVGSLARFIAEAAAGNATTQTAHFRDVQECTEAITTLIEDGDTLLIKGSHGVHLEQLLEVL